MDVNNPMTAIEPDDSWMEFEDAEVVCTDVCCSWADYEDDRVEDDDQNWLDTVAENRYERGMVGNV